MKGGIKGRSAQAGMTFIELLLVTAIIGILTAVAMPNIKNYSARAKVSEAILALTKCRGPVGEVYLAGGDTMPATDSWGCEENNSSKYVAEIHVTGSGDPKGVGIIKVRLAPAVGDARIANADVTLAPMNRSGTVMDIDDMGTSVFRWRCGHPDDGTDVDPTFLPGTCRGF
jgi:type IV pilus assembly protein PilA